MKDNIRTAIGYICIALIIITLFLMIAWIYTPNEWNININADDNLLNITQTVQEIQLESNEEQADKIKGFSFDENLYCYSVPSPPKCNYIVLNNGTKVSTGYCEFTANYILECINKSDIKEEVFI